MGQKQAKNLQDQLKINPSDWSQPTYDSTQDVWLTTHTRTNLDAQQQTITNDPNQNLEYEMEIYHYRKQQDNALVKVYGAEHMSPKDKPLCGNTDNIKVITERIPRRYNELPVLSFPEGVYCLS